MDSQIMATVGQPETPVPLIECKNLSKCFSGFYALNNINLTVYRGRKIGLLGPNGSGKSTFLKLLTGLLTPTSGSILIGGFEPGVETKAMVSYLPERTYLGSGMRVTDIIRYFSDFYEDFEPRIAGEMLFRLGIDPGRKLSTLSKGTKEKVQLIMVMSRRADLYLLDEPIGGVDPASRDYILDTILSACRPEASLIISTHMISDVEKILDDAIFIAGGRISIAGPADGIRSHYGKSLDETFREVYRCWGI